MVEHFSKRRWMVWCEGDLNLEAKAVSVDREWDTKRVFLRREPTVKRLR